MNEYKNVKNIYQNKIISPENSIIEMIEYLKNKIDYRIIDLHKHKYYYEKTKSNIYNSYCNENKKINSDHFIIEVWEIINNEKSSMYYSNFDDTIYVVFEYKTEFISSNSNDLLAELIVKKGINTKDIEKKNNTYMNYLFFLKYAIDNHSID